MLREKLISMPPGDKVISALCLMGKDCSLISELCVQTDQSALVVYATIIAPPSSTKNRDRANVPAMHQTKKGNARRFGMKVLPA